MTKNRQLQANEIVGVNPVLCRLPNESTLIASGRGVPLNWMSASSDEIIELRELDNDSVIVILIERSFLEVFLNESRLQGSVGPFL